MGKAKPSLSPASEVRAKRTSSSAFSASTGSPTCTSEASTGSVGASTAPSRSAAAIGQPGRAMAATATPATVSGMARPSSRHVVDQRRGPARRLMARPAPMREMTTHSSVMCSSAVRWAIGSGSGRPMGSANSARPARRYTRGSDRGRRASTSGRIAASRAAAPPRARRRSRVDITAHPAHKIIDHPSTSPRGYASLAAHSGPMRWRKGLRSRGRGSTSAGAGRSRWRAGEGSRRSCRRRSAGDLAGGRQPAVCRSRVSRRSGGRWWTGPGRARRP